MVGRPNGQHVFDVALSYAVFCATERTFPIIGVRKVVFHQSWDESTGRYMKQADAEKTALCDVRTAVEDVTEVSAVNHIYKDW